MTGGVADGRAWMPVTFRLAGQPDMSIEFVVDTGFTGSLTLPPAAVATLGLPWVAERSANLANDADVQVAVHAASIVWHDTVRVVPVLALGRRPLLGTALLDGNHLGVDFVVGGDVLITPRT